MVSPRFGTDFPTIRREVCEQGERDGLGRETMSGLGILTITIILFAGVVSALGVSSLFTLSRL
ncbi:MAG: hypothetical protein Kow00133_09950 [Amphiplicatus sp.]